jgi:tetratricopeptide (TPR) repeat protein
MPTRRFVLAGLAALFTVGEAWAEDAPDREALFRRLREARTEREGRMAEDAVWRLWMAEGPTAAIREAVAEAMRKREVYDFAGALALLDRVVADAPAYAEGWNQRAFIRFLRDDPDGSLEDIERALALEPRHFAALAGKATILMRQGRMELGQQALRRAVEIHPWLKERAMLIPAPGSAPPRRQQEKEI